VRADGGWAVYRIVHGGARLTPVTLSAMTDREAEIRKGLSDGEHLVIFPTGQVVDGVRARERIP
jgi:HlyD family secretion protein